MRHWTRASFDAAAAFDRALDHDIVWLTPGSRLDRGTKRPAGLPSASKVAAIRATRATSVVGMGCLAATLSAGAAIAPVSTAQAAVDQGPIKKAALPPTAIAAARLDTLPDVEVSAETALRETLQRQEIDAFLTFGGRSIPRHLVQAILRAANDTAVDPIYLTTLAETESSFRPEVKAATSSAVGLFQFIDRTWLEVVRTYGPAHGLEAQAAAIEMVEGRVSVADPELRAAILDLRQDPYLSGVMAAELLKRDAALIGFQIGRKLSETEMYLAHFLGLDEAAKFITLRAGKGRKAVAARSFPAAARANRAIFSERGRKGRRHPLSIDGVYAKIDGLIGGRLSRFRDVTELATGSRA